MFYSIGQNMCFCNFLNSRFCSPPSSQYTYSPFCMIALMRELPWSLQLFLKLAMPFSPLP